MALIEWAICVPQDHAHDLVNLKKIAARQFRSLRVSSQSDSIWVRGSSADTDEHALLNENLKQLSGARRFTVLDDSQLTEDGHTVPQGWLPVSEWQSFELWLQINLPATVLVGQKPELIALKIVRGSSRHTSAGHDPTLLMCDRGQWTNWAINASNLRLQGLIFACDRDRKVIVKTLRADVPLPPIQGKLFVNYGGVYLPVGFSWQPEVSVETLSDIYDGGSTNNIVLIQEDGNWEVIEMQNMTAASRSAVRLSAKTAGRK